MVSGVRVRSAPAAAAARKIISGKLTEARWRRFLNHFTDFFAPMPAFISAAERTGSRRVGTNVLNNDFAIPCWSRH
jgi:hypothetical protein